MCYKMQCEKAFYRMLILDQYKIYFTHFLKKYFTFELTHWQALGKLPKYQISLLTIIETTNLQTRGRPDPSHYSFSFNMPQKIQPT